MSFIAKNPLSMPKIETNPPTPSGTRGLFAKNDGWYDIDDNGDIVKICSNNDIDNHMLKLLEETKLYIDEEIAKFDFIKIMSELPETGEENYIYLIPNNSDESKNIYDEYIWTGNDWEHFGAKQVDVNLDSYAKKSDLSNYVKKEDGKGLSTNDFTNDDKDSIHTHPNKAVLDSITAEKVKEWSGKSNFSGSYNDLKDKPEIQSIEGLAKEEYVDEAIEVHKTEISYKEKLVQMYGTADIEITPAYTYEEATGECLIYADNGDGTATIVDYQGELNDVVIPFEVDGKTVTAIGDRVFIVCDTLTSIIIPNSITTLGESVFDSCLNLISVRLGSGITDISFGTFEFCESLTNIEIPDSVKSIGDYAFYGCLELTNIKIPNSVKSIGDSVFVRTLIRDLVLPDSITSVGEDIIARNRCMKSIAFSKGMTELVSDVLRDAMYIEKVYIPSDIIIIADDIIQNVHSDIVPNPTFYVEQGSAAEEWCKKFNKTYKYTEIDSGVYVLKSEVIAEITPTNNRLDRITYYGDATIEPSWECFYYEENAPDRATLNESSTSLNEISTLVIPYALNGKILTMVDMSGYTLPNNIKSIIIPNCVTHMSYDAIRGSGIESIEIPESVTTLCSEAIMSATSLKKIIIHNDKVHIDTVVYDAGDKGIFSGCHEDLTIYCNPGSTAEAFCIENGLNYSYINYMSERAVKDGKGNIIHDTYATKEELSELSFIKVVSELPEYGKEDYIYLKPNNGDEPSNIYDEYIWVNGVWEYIGTKTVDLSNYITREEFEEEIENLGGSESKIPFTYKLTVEEDVISIDIDETDIANISKIGDLYMTFVVPKATSTATESDKLYIRFNNIVVGVIDTWCHLSYVLKGSLLSKCFKDFRHVQSPLTFGANGVNSYSNGTVIGLIDKQGKGSKIMDITSIKIESAKGDTLPIPKGTIITIGGYLK